jgi:hypothetical protein
MYVMCPKVPSAKHTSSYNFFFLKEFAGTRGLGVLTIFFFEFLQFFFLKEFAGTRGLGITWRWLSLALRCLKRA